MPGLIPENILDDILSRVDIVEVISGYIPLKRAGRNFKTTCPFHHEKTPSFMVSCDRQIYHCFGCGESGNAFKFLMRYERMDFLEAVEVLAKKSGVALPKEERQDPKATSMISQLYKINEAAASFYESNLLSVEGSGARNYLAKRGIKEETAKFFKLGLAPDKWDGLINALRAKNFNLSLLEKAGLILSKSGGGYYDRFRTRIIFPIVDIKERVLGFGARVLDSQLPKYINSPETPIYTKGRNLYGLNFAKDSIRENDFAVIVEGYLDCIIPYQYGMHNIVASLGTALTDEQVRVLKRYTSNVVMVYDADDAGQLATLRTLDIFIEEGVNVMVVSLPKGFDPDTFVRQKGIEEFKNKVKEAVNLFDYKLNILRSRCNPKEIESKARISQEMLQTINKFKNAVLKSEYIKKLAQELDVNEESVLEEAAKSKSDKRYMGAAQKSSVASDKININPTEKLLIKLMLEENDIIEAISKRINPHDFKDEKVAKIISVIFEHTQEGRPIGPNILMNYFGEENVSQVLCESVFMPEVTAEEKDKVINDCIQRIKNERLKYMKEQLHDQIHNAQKSGDQNRLNRLMEEFHSLTRQK